MEYNNYDRLDEAAMIAEDAARLLSKLWAEEPNISAHIEEIKDFVRNNLPQNGYVQPNMAGYYPQAIANHSCQQATANLGCQQTAANSCCQQTAANIGCQQTNGIIECIKHDCKTKSYSEELTIPECACVIKATVAQEGVTQCCVANMCMVTACYTIYIKYSVDGCEHTVSKRGCVIFSSVPIWAENDYTVHLPDCLQVSTCGCKVSVKGIAKICY